MENQIEKQVKWQLKGLQGCIGLVACKRGRKAWQRIENDRIIEGYIGVMIGIPSSTSRYITTSRITRAMEDMVR